MADAFLSLRAHRFGAFIGLVTIALPLFKVASKEALSGLDIAALLAGGSLLIVCAFVAIGRWFLIRHPESHSKN